MRALHVVYLRGASRPLARCSKAPWRADGCAARGPARSSGAPWAHGARPVTEARLRMLFWMDYSAFLLKSTPGREESSRAKRVMKVFRKLKNADQRFINLLKVQTSRPSAPSTCRFERSWAAWAFRLQTHLAGALSTCAEVHLPERPWSPRFNVCRRLHAHPVTERREFYQAPQSPPVGRD